MPKKFELTLIARDVDMEVISINRIESNDSLSLSNQFSILLIQLMQDRASLERMRKEHGDNYYLPF